MLKLRNLQFCATLVSEELASMVDNLPLPDLPRRTLSRPKMPPGLMSWTESADAMRSDSQAGRVGLCFDPPSRVKRDAIAVEGFTLYHTWSDKVSERFWNTYSARSFCKEASAV